MKRLLLSLPLVLATGCVLAAAPVALLSPPPSGEASSEETREPPSLVTQANVRQWWPTIRGSGQADEVFGTEYSSETGPGPRFSYDRDAELDGRIGITMFDAFVGGAGKDAEGRRWVAGGRLDYWAGEWRASNATDEDKDWAGTPVPAGTPFESRMSVEYAALQGMLGAESEALRVEGFAGLGFFRADFDMKTTSGEIENSEMAPLTAGGFHIEWRPAPFFFVSGGGTLTGIAFDAYTYYGELEGGGGVEWGPVHAELGYRIGGHSAGYVDSSSHLRMDGAYFELGVRF